jgi:hypothetical protein
MIKVVLIIIRVVFLEFDIELSYWLELRRKGKVVFADRGYRWNSKCLALTENSSVLTQQPDLLRKALTCLNTSIG